MERKLQYVASGGVSFRVRRNHLGYVVMADASGRPGPGFVVEAIESQLTKRRRRNGFVFKSLCSRQGEARPPCQAFEFPPFGRR